MQRFHDFLNCERSDLPKHPFLHRPLFNSGLYEYIFAVSLANGGSPKVLVTLGPTRAYLDRVRYLSNYSTGSLGFEICEQLRRRGCEVTAVVGPLPREFRWHRDIEVLPVETHEQMLKKVLEVCRKKRPTRAIFAAAVLDFAPARAEAGKVSSRGDWTLRLKPTVKIIDVVGKKFPALEKVAFKLEWRRLSRAAEADLARRYLEKNNLSALCVNYLSEISAEKHPVRIYLPDGRVIATQTKKETARALART